MNLRFSARARRDFADLSQDLKARARKQLDLLSGNLRHPSIQAKNTTRATMSGRVGSTEITAFISRSSRTIT
jgi:hypothetical protein